MNLLASIRAQGGMIELSATGGIRLARVTPEVQSQVIAEKPVILAMLRREKDLGGYYPYTATYSWISSLYDWAESKGLDQFKSILMKVDTAYCVSPKDGQDKAKEFSAEVWQIINPYIELQGESLLSAIQGTFETTGGMDFSAVA